MNSKVRSRTKKLLSSLTAAALALGMVIAGGQVASAAPTPQNCSYADSNSGTYARTLCWFDMSSYDPTAATSAGGQQVQVTLPGGYVLSYTLLLTGRSLFAAALPTYSAASLGRNVYTGVSGRPALYQAFGNPFTATATMQNITMVDANNNPVTAFSIVGADAESTDGDEQLIWTSDQPMNLLEPTGNACDGGLTGVGTTTVVCSSLVNQVRTGGVIVAAEAPTQMSQQLITNNSARAQGVAFGVLISKVQLNKSVASRVDPSDSFGLSVTTNDAITLKTASTGATSSATTGEVETIGAVKSSPFTLSETSGPSAIADYAQSWACTRNGTSDPGLPSGAAGTSAAVVLGIGDLVSCTITNTALPGSLSLQKVAGTVTDVNNNGIRDAGDTIPFSFVVTNTGQLTIENVGITDPLVGAVTCPVTTLAPGASTTCTSNSSYTFSVANQTAGSFTNTATARGNPLGATTTITSNTSATTTTLAAAAPALSLVKSVTPSTVAVTGSSVSYSYLVTNTGNVPITGVGISETVFSGTGTAPVPNCLVTSLAPGSSTTCTATYTTTQADINAGVVTNTARATGTAGATPVVSPDSTATVTAPASPALALVKSASPSDAASFVVGQVITYTFVATNTGNVTLTNVGVAETAFTGSGGPLTLNCPASTPIAPGGQVSCTATYTLTQADIDSGQVTNTAIASGTPPTGGPINSPPADVVLPANQVPAITLTKTASPTSIALAGDSITYSFVVTNSGNVTLTDVTVDETAFSGTGTPPVINCPGSISIMLPGASVTCTATYILTQPDADTTSVTNTATATGTPPPASGGPITSAPSTVVVEVTQNPALTMTKTASPLQASAAGDLVTYSFTVTNTGDVTVTGVSINEVSFTGSGPALSVSCPSGALSLAPTETVVCTATYTVTQADVDAGSIQNTATAEGTPPSGGNVESPESSVAVPITPSPGVTLIKTASTPNVTTVGEIVTYSFVVTNTGNVTLSATGITETIFTGHGVILTPVCPPGFDTLLPGASVTCTADYVVTQADLDAGKIENTATVSGTAPGGTPITSPPSTINIEAQPAPALTVQKTVTPGSVIAAGQQVSYSYLITNTGNVTLTDVTAIEGTFTGAGPVSVVTCPAEAASLAPGDTVTCAAPYTVTQSDMDAGTVTNTATAEGTPPAGGNRTVSPPSSATFTAIVTPQLSLVKTANPTNITSAGQSVTYSFVVTNTGNVTMTNIAVSEELFSGTGTPPVITCPPAPISLAPGNTVTCTATYVVTQADVDAGVIDNTAVVSGAPVNSPQTAIQYPPSSSTVTSLPQPAVSIVKSATPSDQASFVAGAVITYSFVVTNSGNVTLADVSVTETAFTGTGVVSTPICPAEAASLIPGAQVICTSTYTVTQADVDAGGVDNTATASGLPPTEGTTVTSTPSTVHIPQTATPSISLVKTAVASGDSVTYGFTVTNTGNVTVSDIAITETSFSGSGSFPAVRCPGEPIVLLPGATIVCTATYVLTTADRALGTLTNTAVAHASGPAGPLVSDPSTATVSFSGLPVTGFDDGTIQVIAATLMTLGLLCVSAARLRKRRARSTIII